MTNPEERIVDIDVAKEMRGRYPKHNWPDAPWEGVASLKTKKAQARDTPRNA